MSTLRREVSPDAESVSSGEDLIPIDRLVADARKATKTQHSSNEAIVSQAPPISQRLPTSTTISPSTREPSNTSSHLQTALGPYDNELERISYLSEHELRSELIAVVSRAIDTGAVNVLNTPERRRHIESHASKLQSTVRPDPFPGVFGRDVPLGSEAIGSLDNELKDEMDTFRAAATSVASGSQGRSRIVDTGSLYLPKDEFPQLTALPTSSPASLRMRTPPQLKEKDDQARDRDAEMPERQDTFWQFP